MLNRIKSTTFLQVHISIYTVFFEHLLIFVLTLNSFKHELVNYQTLHSQSSHGQTPTITKIIPPLFVSQLMGIIDQDTKLVNKTDQRITFDVDDGIICPLRDLPPGRSRSVSLALIMRRCRQHGSADWPIRVLINGRFYGMQLHPRRHLLIMTRIVFRYRWGLDGSSVLIAEGVMENFVDRVFGCCINWKKRIPIQIAEADSTWGRSTRLQQQNEVNQVVRNGNKSQSSDIGDPHRHINLSSSSSPSPEGPENRQVDDEGDNESIENEDRRMERWKKHHRQRWNAAVVSRRRDYRRRLSRRRSDYEFHHFPLFAFTLFLVVYLHCMVSTYMHG